MSIWNMACFPECGAVHPIRAILLYGELHIVAIEAMQFKSATISLWPDPDRTAEGVPTQGAVVWINTWFVGPAAGRGLWR